MYNMTFERSSRPHIFKHSINVYFHVYVCIMALPAFSISPKTHTERTKVALKCRKTPLLKNTALTLYFKMPCKQTGPEVIKLFSC